METQTERFAPPPAQPPSPAGASAPQPFAVPVGGPATETPPDPGASPATDNPPARQSAAGAPHPPAVAGGNQPALLKALLSAVQERAQRAEKGVLRSMAEQTGVEETALAAMLSQARADQTQAEAEAQQQTQTERLHRRLIAAEVKAVGAELGLLDAEVALGLMDAGAVAVSEEGGVTGVREALEALRTQKRYLFRQPGRDAWAQRVGAGGLTPLSGVQEAFYRKNPALRK